MATHGEKSIERCGWAQLPRSSNAYSCYTLPRASPPRRNKAVFYGMGVWFRGSGLVGYIVHAQSTVHLEFIKGYRCVYRADNDEMLGPLLRRWGGGALAVLRQLVSNP